MKDYKASLHQSDPTGNAATGNVTRSWRAQRKLKSYGELSLDGETRSLHGETTLFSREYLERHPLERQSLERKNKEYREVCKSVSAHSHKLTRQQKKRMGIIPSVRCE